MGVEIERKFLVNKELWELSKPKNGVLIIQGYLLTEKEKSIRVRIKGKSAFITIKGKTKNISRNEYEFPIPLEDAKSMLDTFCPKRIEKTRFNIQYKGKLWEVDEFIRPRNGLILAEIELDSEEEKFEKPQWVENEVSNDSRYYNANIVND